jgi:xanthomonalisin
MWAGVWALIGQGHNLTTISNGLEQIYALGKAKSAGFVDITSGSNGGPGDVIPGGYPTAAGYDLATGWGTPNVAQLIASAGWQP